MPTSSSPASNGGGTLESLRYSSGGVGDENGGGKTGPSLAVLDQLLVPEEKVYVDIPSVDATWTAIRTMQIRGAPLIAIVACLGLAVDLNTNPETLSALDEAAADEKDAASKVRDVVKTKVEYLRTSRPTAVNLFHALDEVEGVVDDAVSKAESGKEAREAVVSAVTRYAEAMLESDVRDNESIGAHGAEAILDHHRKKKSDDEGENCGSKVKIVTICNTGSLATAGFGTALGVVRELNRRGKLESVTALETRPYNQGSRLTAFEIVEDDLPGGTLICDSMAAALMKTKGVDACVVGADRVCANGDTANKIGTYQLALVASAHDVPFYVAAPFTTLDATLGSGDDIEIEERPAKELIETSRAPKGIGCWNPAFDVTPARLITGIVTERGVIERTEDGKIDVAGFKKKHSTVTSDEAGEAPAAKKPRV